MHSKTELNISFSAKIRFLFIYYSISTLFLRISWFFVSVFSGLFIYPIGYPTYLFQFLFADHLLPQYPCLCKMTYSGHLRSVICIFMRILYIKRCLPNREASAVYEKLKILVVILLVVATFHTDHEAACLCIEAAQCSGRLQHKSGVGELCKNCIP